jgi:putative tryptophan/tyrosine transport system substrate-binding protein
MMNRRTFIAIAATGFGVCIRMARAQQTDKVWRVGFLAGGARPADGEPPKPLRDELQALGYAQGKTIVYEGRWSGGRNDRLPDLAAELLSRKVDLIVAAGGTAANAVKQLSSTTPIIVFNAGDLVETGLVASLARPGGNMTGINDPAAVLSAKRLEILKELVPPAKRIAVLWNARSHAMTLRYKEIERAAQTMGMTIDALGVREPDDFEVAFAAMTRARPDALMMVTDVFTNLNRQRVLDYVGAQQIPAMYEFGDIVRAGGLISYGSDLNDTFKMAAHYVAKVLKGTKPEDLPVEQPNRYFLVVNVRTAKKLGLAIPQALLLRADEVIE